MDTVGHEVPVWGIRRKVNLRAKCRFKDASRSAVCNEDNCEPAGCRRGAVPSVGEGQVFVSHMPRVLSGAHEQVTPLTRRLVCAHVHTSADRRLEEPHGEGDKGQFSVASFHLPEDFCNETKKKQLFKGEILLFSKGSMPSLV